MANDEMRFRDGVARASRHKPETTHRLDHGEVHRRHSRGLGWGHGQKDFAVLLIIIFFLYDADDICRAGQPQAYAEVRVVGAGGVKTAENCVGTAALLRPSIIIRRKYIAARIYLLLYT
jgi:hypothetical protein